MVLALLLLAPFALAVGFTALTTAVGGSIGTAAFAARALAGSSRASAGGAPKSQP